MGWKTNFPTDLNSEWRHPIMHMQGSYSGVEGGQYACGLRDDDPVIARSFTELLARCYANRGNHPYWLRPEFVLLGDAYDA